MQGTASILRHYVDAINKVQDVGNATGQRDPAPSPYKWQGGKRERVYQVPLVPTLIFCVLSLA